MSKEFESNLQNIANSIGKELNALFIPKLRILGVYDKDVKENYIEEFNQFVLYINKSVSKIYNYCLSDSLTPKVYTFTTKNFIFKYTINPDKSSEFHFSLIKNIVKRFPPSFLKNRVKPLIGYVYILKSEYGYKIGKARSISNRMSDFSVLLPFEFSVHSYVKCVEFNSLEPLLHKYLTHKRINGEWFQLNEIDFQEIDLILNNMNLKRDVYNG